MRLFRRRPEEPRERRLPQNSERRRVFDELKAAASLAERRLVEGTLNDTDRRLEAVAPRIEYLRAVARAYGR